MVWREGVVWTGVKKVEKRTGVYLLFSLKVWAGVEGHGWCGLRIIWVTGRLGIVNLPGCVYVPVTGKGKKGKMEIKWFWEDKGLCLSGFGSKRIICMLEDMNGKVGNLEVGCMVGR